MHVIGKISRLDLLLALLTGDDEILSLSVVKIRVSHGLFDKAGLARLKEACKQIYRNFHILVIISLWAVFVSLVASGFSGVVGGAVFSFTGNGVSGLFMIGVALVALGLGVLCFFGCKAATKGAVILTKKMVLWFKNALLRKEKAK